MVVVDIAHDTKIIKNRRYSATIGMVGFPKADFGRTRYCRRYYVKIVPKPGSETMLEPGRRRLLVTEHRSREQPHQHGKRRAENLTSSLSPRAHVGAQGFYPG